MLYAKRYPLGHTWHFNGRTLSQLGRGSSFTVELPVIQSPSLDRESKLGKNGGNDSPSLANLTILVVEDEADAREMLTLTLEQHGVTVVTADSVKQALIEYEQHQPDILISDISMPTEDGYALIRQIRSSHNSRNNIPAIALTTYARKEDKQLALNAGFNLHLPKPIEPLRLIESLSQLIKKKRNHNSF